MNKALFLDRDGVINEDRHFVYKKEDVHFNDGIFQICKNFYDNGYYLFVITNQSGIARGLYSEDDFQKLTRWMHERFLQHGVEIAETYYCPFHPEANIAKYRRESFDRKPNPGLILKAQKEFELDLAHSVLVGDRGSDITAGKRAGVGMTVLYKGPYNPERSGADLLINSLYELEQLVQ